MTTKHDAVSGVLVGVGAGSAGAAVALLLFAGASEEAIFALIGALIGAAATVAGAAWLSDRNAHREQTAELALLIKEYAPLLRRSTDALEATPGTNMPWTPAYRDALRELTVRAGEATLISQEALEHAKRLTFGQRVRIKQLSAATTAFAAFYNEVNAPEWEDSPYDERNWPEMIGNVRFEAIEALVELGATAYKSEH